MRSNESLHLHHEAPPTTGSECLMAVEGEKGGAISVLALSCDRNCLEPSLCIIL